MEQLSPYGASLRYSLCLLNVRSGNIRPGKNKGEPPAGSSPDPGIFPWYPAPGKTITLLMKGVPETDQPAGSNNSHQKTTENFNTHAPDYGKSAENAEHAGGKTVRGIGEYLPGIQP